MSCKGAELAIAVQQRNAHDNASKLTFARKLASLGITAKQIVIDTAQAGGICGNADCFNMESKEFLDSELKGSCAKPPWSDEFAWPNAQPQLTVQGVCFEGARVVETNHCGQGPNSDSDGPDQRGRPRRCGFWLGRGVASRGRCEQALAAADKSLRDLWP